MVVGIGVRQYSMKVVGYSNTTFVVYISILICELLTVNSVNFRPACTNSPPPPPIWIIHTNLKVQKSTQPSIQLDCAACLN